MPMAIPVATCSINSNFSASRSFNLVSNKLTSPLSTSTSSLCRSRSLFSSSLHSCASPSKNANRSHNSSFSPCSLPTSAFDFDRIAASVPSVWRRRFSASSVFVSEAMRRSVSEVSRTVSADDLVSREVSCGWMFASWFDRAALRDSDLVRSF